MADVPSNTSGPESDYVVTPDSSEKKPSLFGKLKDKTKKAGSRIKSKVGKKHHPDGTPVDHDGEEDDEFASDDSPSPATPASPVTTTPRSFGNEPSRLSGEKDQHEAPDVSGLNLNESAPPAKSFDEPEHKSYNEPKSYEPEQEPPVTEKASEASQGAKDTAYGGAAATAGAFGYDASSKNDREEDKPVTEKAADTFGFDGASRNSGDDKPVTEKAADSFGSDGSSKNYGEDKPVTEKAADAFGSDGSSKNYGEDKPVTEKAADTFGFGTASKNDEEEKPVAEKASEATQNFGGKVEEVGDKDYDAAADSKDTVAEQTKDTFGTPGAYSSNTDSAFGTKDEAGSKASETKDVAEEKGNEAKDTVQSKGADLNNATDDSEAYTEKAANTAESGKDSAADTFGVNNSSSDEPSLVQKAKATAGFDSISSEQPSIVEQAQAKASELNNSTQDSKSYTEKAQNTAVAAKESTAETLGSNQPSQGPSVVDTAKEKVEAAKATTSDVATPKQEDKALSEKITEALGGLPTKAQETVATATQSAKSPTTTTPGTITDAPAAHSEEHPASPGILGKIGGLFGYGAKAPEHHDTTTGATTPH